MNRDQLIRNLRRYARRQGIAFEVFMGKAKESHYLVELGNQRTTIQDKLNPGRVERILKQLRVDPADL